MYDPSSIGCSDATTTLYTKKAKKNPGIAPASDTEEYATAEALLAALPDTTDSQKTTKQGKIWQEMFRWAGTLDFALNDPNSGLGPKLPGEIRSNIAAAKSEFSEMENIVSALASAKKTSASALDVAIRGAMTQKNTSLDSLRRRVETSVENAATNSQQELDGVDGEVTAAKVRLNHLQTVIKGIEDDATADTGKERAAEKMAERDLDKVVKKLTDAKQETISAYETAQAKADSRFTQVKQIRDEAIQTLTRLEKEMEDLPNNMQSAISKLEGDLRTEQYKRDTGRASVSAKADHAKKAVANLASDFEASLRETFADLDTRTRDGLAGYEADLTRDKNEYARTVQTDLRKLEDEAKVRGERAERARSCK
jgi:hypothetical protein